MKEFFIYANSFAAPFISDDSSHFVEAENAREALEKFARTYSHPAGLYAANAYESADAYHKNEKPLSRWRCNHEIKRAEIADKIKGGYSYLSQAPGKFEIDQKPYVVEKPKDGRILA